MLTTEENHKRALKIVAGMAPWFRDIENDRTASHDDRTPNERVFDFGVMAAAEFVRRLTGDESLALEVHECCTFKRKGL